VKAVIAALGVGAVAALITIAAWAQTPAPQPAQPTFRTEANYVRVDVYPTKDGAPVTDLRQEDFEVIEAGEPQKIEQFERVLIENKIMTAEDIDALRKDVLRETNQATDEAEAMPYPEAADLYTNVHEGAWEPWQ